jgi:hypothetical protein
MTHTYLHYPSMWPVAIGIVAFFVLMALIALVTSLVETHKAGRQYRAERHEAFLKEREVWLKESQESIWRQ